MGRGRAGFTLPELLAVITIVLVVSALALPAILPALANRRVAEASRLLHAALVGARDEATGAGRPSGIRLIPDPAWPITRTASGTIDPAAPLAYSRLVPIAPAPEYSEGRCTPYAPGSISHLSRHGVTISIPAAIPAAYPKALLLLESPASPVPPHAPNAPASWSWNVRVGDRVQVGGAGPWYTVAGPMGVPPAGAQVGRAFVANGEMFVNTGPPGVDVIPRPRIGGRAVEFLILTNGRDDDGNGWTDEGWDGIDNDGDALADEPDEWEVEAWAGAVATAPMADSSYTILRRPAPAPGAREVGLPSGIVIDAARSRLPIDPLAGTVDLLIAEDGSVSPSLPYGVPASLGLGSASYHFALADRSDVAGANPPPPKESWRLISIRSRTGQIVETEEPDPARPFAYADRGGR